MRLEILAQSQENRTSTTRFDFDLIREVFCRMPVAAVLTFILRCPMPRNWEEHDWEEYAGWIAAVLLSVYVVFSPLRDICLARLLTIHGFQELAITILLGFVADTLVTGAARRRRPLPPRPLWVVIVTGLIHGIAGFLVFCIVRGT